MYVIVYLFIILCVYRAIIDRRIILICRNLLGIHIYAKKKLLNVFHSYLYSYSYIYVFHKIVQKLNLT